MNMKLALFLLFKGVGCILGEALDKLGLLYNDVGDFLLDNVLTTRGDKLAGTLGFYISISISQQFLNNAKKISLN